MKKSVLIGIIVGAVVLVGVIIGIIAFSGGFDEESKYLGTWDIHSVKIDGSILTIEEVEVAYDDTLSDFRVIIKEGGKAYLHVDGESELIDWTLTEEDGFMLGEQACIIEDGMLTFQFYEVVLYFTRTSKSQTITAPEKPANTTTTTTTRPTTTKPTTTKPTTTKPTTTTTNNDTPDRNYAEWRTLAKQIAEQDNLSKYETVTELLGYGCDLEAAEEYADAANVNWNVLAKKRAESFDGYYATVFPNMVRDLLVDYEFLESEIEYAIEYANIDWKVYAVIHANSYISYNESEYYISPLDVILHLEWEKGYTVEDSEYGLEHCDVDWNEKALEYMDVIEMDGPYAQKSQYIFWLAEAGFAQSEIEYAIENCGIDWYAKAVYCLEHYIEDLCTETPSQEECENQLADWGFNSDEIAYAIDEFEDVWNGTQYLVFTLNSDNQTYAVIDVNYLGAETIIIPSMYKGQEVTRIEIYAFAFCASLTSVTIPKTVTSIEAWAFQDCYSLERIDFDGTIEQWNAISKSSIWNGRTSNYTIYCTDGTITKNGTVTYN